MPSDPRFIGFMDYRYDSMPAEKACADFWENFNLRGGYTTVAYILDHVGSSHPPEPSLRDYRIVATIIQWLATPVGRGFVEELVKNKIIQLIPERE